jgi:pSer/pThr/pTyr-binding forkhead associated (FHA) protein
MNCAYCNIDIESDSFYCDQCGKELFICPTCGKSRKGKNCTEDGSKLYSPKQRSLNVIQNTIMTTGTSSTIPQPGIQESEKSVIPPSPNELKTSILKESQSIPILKLINRNLNIDIEIKDGSIIGRTTGEHVEVFENFTQISGQHLQFFIDKNSGWAVKDLGSTNGSFVNSKQIWENIPKINPSIPVPLSNGMYLLIANIEFQIKIILSDISTPTGTQRL